MHLSYLTHTPCNNAMCPAVPSPSSLPICCVVCHPYSAYLPACLLPADNEERKKSRQTDDMPMLSVLSLSTTLLCVRGHFLSGHACCCENICEILCGMKRREAGSGGRQALLPTPPPKHLHPPKPLPLLLPTLYLPPSFLHGRRQASDMSFLALSSRHKIPPVRAWLLGEHPYVHFYATRGAYARHSPYHPFSPRHAAVWLRFSPLLLNLYTHAHRATRTPPCCHARTLDL